MKKIISLLCFICLCVCLSGCNSKNEDDILTFFQAFHNTLDADSATIEGTLSMPEMDDSSISIHMQLCQTGNLELALTTDLKAGENRQENFLNFYIKEGKTYLNSMGTKSQSILSNLGIEKDQKISVYDPFMNFTDEELTQLVQSSSHKDNDYTFELDNQIFSTLLDSYGSVSIDSATLKATIQDDILTYFSLHIQGVQNIDSASEDIDFTISCQIQDFDQLDHVTFPDDLESY